MFDSVNLPLASLLLLLALVWPSVRAASCGSMDSAAAFRCAGKQDLNRAKSLRPNTGIAKNLMVFVGDGMGVSTVTAGRIFDGQKAGNSGEEHSLFFETLPSVGLSKTYNPDRQVSDSAGTATAIFSGVKGNYRTLGVDPSVNYKSTCDEVTNENRLQTVIDYGLQEGKSVGIVTNARITHATPAAAYAHTPDRNWESDTDQTRLLAGRKCEEVKDIALQLIEDNPDIHVILGGGRRSFLPNTVPDPATGSVDLHQRSDNRSLIEEWKADKKLRGKRYQYVDTKGELDSVDADTTDFLFGLFSSGHMAYETDRDSSPGGQPSVSEMTSKAIDILDKNPKGFVLIAEGARIDHAHHKNEGKKALVEVGEFDNAIRTAYRKIGSQDTLTVVTADHSHVFDMAGYPKRGNDILGLVDPIEEGEAPADGMPYTTLTYANGPEAGRKNLTGVDTTQTSFRFPSCIEMSWETHGGEDVAIYAVGPMAHLVHTTHEQSYIGHVLMYAACMGDYRNDADCDRSSRDSPKPSGAKIVSSRSNLVILKISCVFVFLYFFIYD